MSGPASERTAGAFRLPHLTVRCLRFRLWAVLVEGGCKRSSCRRNGSRAVQNDILRGDLPAVHPLVCIIIRTQGGPLEGYAGEKPSSARVGQNFCTHRCVCICFGVPALWSRGCGRVGSELHFAAENPVGALVVHHE